MIDRGKRPSWPPVARREILAWAMFDFANSSYTTVIVTVAFSVFFTRLVAGGPNADALWGSAIFWSNLVVVILSPFVGAVADESGRKKLFLFATYAVCVAGTAALVAVEPGRVALALTLFIVSNVAYSFGENFCASFLPEISTPANCGRISGFGWGLGYFGGLASLLVAKPFLEGGFVVANVGNLKVAWLVTAAFFGVAGLPTFLVLRERAERRRHSVAGFARIGFERLISTLKALRHFRELAKFLVVFFVYSAGLSSVIAFVGVYADHTMGFTPGELVWLFLLVQISSAAGAIAFGVVQDRLGARITIQSTLVFWIAVCAATYLAHAKSTFWGIALAAGLAIGSLQSASRAVVSIFSPPSKSGEFLGFWGLAGKGAYAVGPLVFGLVSSATGSQRAAILSVAAFFVAGFLGLFAVSERRGVEAAESWRDPVLE